MHSPHQQPTGKKVRLLNPMFESFIQEMNIMENTTKTTGHEMQVEDRQFLFSMSAATLLSFAITFIAVELI